LPKEWKILLEEAGITKQEQAANPQAIIDVIGFYTGGQLGAGDKYMMNKSKEAPPQPPRPGAAPVGREAPKPPAKAPAMPARPGFPAQGGMVGGDQLKLLDEVVEVSAVPAAQPTIMPGVQQAYSDPILDSGASAVPPPKPSSELTLWRTISFAANLTDYILLLLH
jgi:p21-activated kinase 1